MQNHCIALNIIPNLKFLLRYAAFLHTSVLFYIGSKDSFVLYIVTKQHYYEEQTSTKTKQHSETKGID